MLRDKTTGELIPMARHHLQAGRWCWRVEPGQSQAAFVGIWPRGGGKSSLTERLAASLAARRKKRYVLYVSGKQEQANEHLDNIRMFLRSDIMRGLYPELSEREEDEYGRSLGWRANRIRTAAGATFDAVGLDTLIRGTKIDIVRPDLIILDDIDSELDTEKTVTKKIDIITRRILPSGSNDLTVVFIQNLVHEQSVCSMLAGVANDPVMFLSRREVAGPIPALYNMTWHKEQPSTDYPRGREQIDSGEPVWEGQTLEVCQRFVDTYGMRAFLAECQHDVASLSSGLFRDVQFSHCQWNEVPWEKVIAIEGWLDPAITDTEQADAHGLQIDALSEDGTLYRLFSFEERADPLSVIKLAVSKVNAYGGKIVGIETNIMGSTSWARAYQRALEQFDPPLSDPPVMRSERTPSSLPTKLSRWNEMLFDYLLPGKIIHVISPENPTHQILEAALRRAGMRKPFDLADAAFWGWWSLSHQERYSDSGDKGFVHFTINGVDPQAVPWW